MAIWRKLGVQKIGNGSAGARPAAGINATAFVSEVPAVGTCRSDMAPMEEGGFGRRAAAAQCK